MTIRQCAGILLVGQVCWVGILFAEQVRVPQGTPVRVRLKAALMSDHAKEGDRVDFQVAQPVLIGGVTVIPKGALAWGAVQTVKKGLYVRFDIQGLQLPNGREVMLRSVPKKSTNPSEDQIRIDLSTGKQLGVPAGSEFTAYIDNDEDLDAVNTPSSGTPVGEANIMTNPRGIEVLIDGRSYGPSPVRVTLALGQHTYTLNLPGREPYTRPFEIRSDGSSVTKMVDLGGVVGPPGVVEVRTIPPGASVLVDGEAVLGLTPTSFRLPPGKHTLVIKLAGRRTVQQVIDLPPGKTVAVYEMLVP